MKPIVTVCCVFEAPIVCDFWLSRVGCFSTTTSEFTGRAKHSITSYFFYLVWQPPPDSPVFLQSSPLGLKPASRLSRCGRALLMGPMARGWKGLTLFVSMNKSVITPPFRNSKFISPSGVRWSDAVVFSCPNITVATWCSVGRAGRKSVGQHRACGVGRRSYLFIFNLFHIIKEKVKMQVEGSIAEGHHATITF